MKRWRWIATMALTAVVLVSGLGFCAGSLHGQEAAAASVADVRERPTGWG